MKSYFHNFNSILFQLSIVMMGISSSILAQAESCRYIFLKTQIETVKNSQNELLSIIYRKYGETDRMINAILTPLVASKGITYERVEEHYRSNIHTSTGQITRLDAIRAAHLTVASLNVMHPRHQASVDVVQNLFRTQLSTYWGRGRTSTATDLMVESLLTKAHFLKYSSGNPRLTVPRVAFVYRRLLDHLSRAPGELSKPNQEHQIVAAHLTSAILSSNQTTNQVVAAYLKLRDEQLDHVSSTSFNLWQSETAAILTEAYIRSKMPLKTFGNLFQDMRRGTTRNLTHEDDIQAAYMIYAILGP